MFGHVLNQGQEATLGIVPSIGTQLLVVWFQALYHTRNTKLIVAFGTIKSSKNNNNNIFIFYILLKCGMTLNVKKSQSLLIWL